MSKKHLQGFQVLLALFAALIFGSDFSYSQGSAADYDRASELNRRYAGKVHKASIMAHWFEEGTKFWYRNDLRGGEREFILVDALAGTRKPAFDHQRLAELLAEDLGKKVEPQRLPVNRLEYGEGVIVLKGRDKSWSWNLSSDELQPAPVEKVGEESTVEVLAAPRPSRGSSAETSVRFVSRIDRDAKLLWIGTDGKPVEYHTLKPGAEHLQHTFAGHVWMAKDPDGKLLNVFVANEDEGTAIITGKRPSPEKWIPNRRPRGRSNTSPDGKYEAFFRRHNLHLRELETGEESPLSKDGSEDDRYEGRIWWSPDSKHLVALRTKQGSDHKVYYVESSPDDQLQPKLHSYNYLKPGDDIALSKPRLFDLIRREPIEFEDEMFPNPWAISNLRWEPDSSAFTFLYNQRGHQVMRVLSVDASSGSVRPLVDETPDTFFCYSSKTFLKHLPETKELIWMSERSGWNHLYLYDTETGQMKNPITQGEWVVRKVTEVDEEKRQIWFEASGMVPGQDPYHIHHARVNFDGGDLVFLTQGDGTHAIEFSPDRRFFIDAWSRVDQAPVHELRRTRDGSLVCALETAEISALRETGWHPPERFAAKGRDGRTDIHGIIIRPSNHDPSKSYPVIEDIYAGPHDSFVPKSFRSFFQMQSLAELGFIVVKIDGMGTSNRSKAFHDVAWKNLGDSGFPDRIKWIRAAAAKDPSMDLSRVGIYGGSAGGQSSTRALLMHPDFYKVAVSDCGCHDNRVDKIWWNEQWMGWPIGPHYEEQSNVTQAHRLKGNLLLIVGEMDENVDPASTMQVVDALVKADRDFDLLVIPGTGHGAAGTKYGRRRLMDYFVEHLLDVEPRWKN